VGGHEGGSQAVEFALAAPVLLLMLSAFVEFGMYILGRVTLEGSLRDIARYGITGQVPPGGDRVAEMLRMIGRSSGGLIDPAQVVLQVQSYPTFEDVGLGEDFADGNANGSYDAGETFKDCNGNGVRDTDRGTSGAGGSGEVVLYRIDYDWPMWTAMLTPLIGHDGKLHVQTSTVVRNEPWDPDAARQQPRNCDL
jgi:Flp pilus assembly protein TadG